jgi:hypothetical protein
VLVRVDFNTPVAEVDGRLEVTDDFRIRACLPLFEELLARGAAWWPARTSAVPRAGRRALQRRAGAPAPQRALSDVELLENLRFNPARRPTTRPSARRWSRVRLLRQRGLQRVAPGPRLDHDPPDAGAERRRDRTWQREVATWSLLEPGAALRRHRRRRQGGRQARRSCKVLCEKADTVIVGGGMAYTFAGGAQGRTIGSSLFDASYVDSARAARRGIQRAHPQRRARPRVGAPFGGAGGPDPASTFGADIPDGFVGLDIGPAPSRPSPR